MNNDNNIENLFRKRFNAYKEQPSERVWREVRRKLKWQNFKHFRWNSFNIYYLAGIFLIGAAVWFAINRNSFTDFSVENIGEGITDFDSTGKKGRSEQILESREKDELASRAEKKLPREKKNLEEKISKGETELKTESPKESQKTETEIIPDSITKDSVYFSPIPLQDQNNEINKGITLQPADSSIRKSSMHAFFIPSQSKGCTPLQVKFMNSSMEASEYNWNFGDGGRSVEKEPVYIFDEPGKYFVSLVIRDENGELSSYSDIITVHPLPDVLFEMDVNDTPGEGKTVYFYNYSRGAENYRWDFGDSTFSELKEPLKVFETEEDRNIKLIGISTHGCKDSMIVEDAFYGDIPELIFPNAFSPNPDGPTGGYYTKSERTNEVFHPYMPEEPLEYTLKIFNKAGNLVFESTDPGIGWDGYYLQELQPQGVYVYKVKAIFKNGKQHVKMGDVTLIYQRNW